jgi:hypothetical protein
MNPLLPAVFVVITIAPPLSPAEAVRVLRGSQSLADRTNVYVLTPDDDGPRSIVIRSKPGDGPFGPFPKYEPRPQYVHGITFKLPPRRH